MQYEPLTPCGNGTKFTVIIITDDHPEETEWNVIHNISKRVAMSGGSHLSIGWKKKLLKCRF